MKSLYNYVTEHFITILPVDSQEEQIKYAEKVWPIIDNAYKYIGGFAGCKTYNDFIKEFVDNKVDDFLWKLVRRGNEITAIKIYKIVKNTRKSVAMAAIPTEQGKHDLNMILDEDMRLKERGAWAECSGKALGTYLNKGYIVLPNSVAQHLLPNKEVELLNDGYFYRRLIDGKLRTKLIVGYPPTDIVGEKPSNKMITHLKELGKKYEVEQ